MNITLESIVEKGSVILDYFNNLNIVCSVENLEDKVVELQSNIKLLQTVSMYLANISNNINKFIIRKKRQKKIPISNKYIETNPTIYDVGTLTSANPSETKEIEKSIFIPAITVQNIEDVPTYNIYYVEDIKQYCINIAGILIRGDLCNIVDYQTEKSAECEYGSSCNSFKTGEPCKYYHDVRDYQSNNKPVPIDNHRNFTVGSWIYSKTKNPRTYFARHLGSKDRLLYDLQTLKYVQYKNEISNREGQLIHDLLIYMILNNQGLLKNHPHWKGMPKSI